MRATLLSAICPMRSRAPGELKHGTMSEEKYSNQAATYGKVFALSEDDILNDDLGAFNRIQRMLGRGSALSLNKVIWTEFLANAATFWTVLRKNRMTGAGSALDIASLSHAVTMLETQTDPSGDPMGTMAAVLVVPSELKILANQIANDREIRYLDDGSTTKPYSVANPHAGKYSVASSAYLNNAKIPVDRQRIGCFWLTQRICQRSRLFSSMVSRARESSKREPTSTPWASIGEAFTDSAHRSKSIELRYTLLACNEPSLGYTPA